MSYRWLSLILAVGLAGCATTPVAPTTVKIPIAVTAVVPPLPPRPTLPLPVPPTATPAQTAQAYRTSVLLLQSYALQLETLLKGLQPLAPPPTKP